VFEAKVYECSTPFRGDPELALGLAKEALREHGFAILPGSSAELRAEGPGVRSFHRSALLGVSEIRIQIAASTLTVSATLGGVAAANRLATFLPPAVALLLVISRALLGRGVAYPGLWFAALWLVASPRIEALVERRTTQAVDHLAREIAVAALPD